MQIVKTVTIGEPEERLTMFSDELVYLREISRVLKPESMDSLIRNFTMPTEHEPSQMFEYNGVDLIKKLGMHIGYWVKFAIQKSTFSPDQLKKLQIFVRVLEKKFNFDANMYVLDYFAEKHQDEDRKQSIIPSVNYNVGENGIRTLGDYIRLREHILDLPLSYGDGAIYTIGWRLGYMLCLMMDGFDPKIPIHGIFGISEDDSIYFKLVYKIFSCYLEGNRYEKLLILMS